MSVHSFAKALFKIADQKNAVQEWLTLLDQISMLFEHHPRIFRYFASPIAELDEQQRIFDQNLKPLLPVELSHFFLMLLQKKMMARFPEIFAAFKRRSFEKLGIAEGTIITALPLNAIEKKLLTDTWEAKLQKKLDLLEKQDPALIGGGILFIGDQFLDFSLKGKLKRLKTELHRT